MQQAFSQWNLGSFDPGYFVLHTGDVCMLNMGLAKKEYESLKRDTGQVIHLAMTPMYHLPYQHFRRIWLPELERMIAFCGDVDYPKFLHYTSSYNANFFHDEEDFRALNSNAWQSGYAGFKWVANQAIRNAETQDLGCCVYDIPLVLGSEKNGICPGHYSIWLILDIFLKTGYFFPFTFNIIPIDILAEIIVLNVVNTLNSEKELFIRPLLSEPVTDKLFAKTAANLLGLKESELSVVRESCQNKLRFDFMLPANFYDLLAKVNHLPAVFPKSYDAQVLPLTTMVFLSNLNKILTRKMQ
jgi:thioester reductase-like protein